MDCIEGMKRLPDCCIDLMIIDPPYNVTATDWDKEIDMNEMWKQFKRIRKPYAPILIFGIEPFSSKIRLSNLKEYRYDWVWVKSRPTGFVQAKNKPMRKHEIISVFCQYGAGHQSRMGNKRMPYYPQGLKPIHRTCKKSKRKFGSTIAIRGCQKEEYEQLYTNYPTSVLPIASEGRTCHPTQKPIDLLEYLVKTYSNESECVLDCCIGSGTTAIAAIRNNRNFIGFELDEEYYNIANERIQEELCKHNQ